MPSFALLPEHVLQNFGREQLHHRGRNWTRSNLPVRHSSVILSDGHFYGNRRGSVLESGCEENKTDGCDVGSEIDVWVIETALAGKGQSSLDDSVLDCCSESRMKV